MPLNYSKWDQLELSDDSDIEEHPNVDKKSMIRWKQRDIHEKREVRKHKIVSLKAEIACNEVLLPRLKTLKETLASEQKPASYFSQQVDRLKTNPSDDKPPTNAPGQPTYDAMILSLLLQVGEKARSEVGSNLEESEKEEKLGKKVTDGIAEHIVKLGERTEEMRKELEVEEKEAKKHITSDDIHDGFSSSQMTKAEAPKPVPKQKAPGTTTKTTEIEVLNPGAVAASSSAAQATGDDDDIPEMTPTLEAFSKIPLQAYEESFRFIQTHKDVIVPGASDALLVAAFQAQRDGKPKLSKQCVHQSLLLQYCDKLGKDGVGLFFKKMIAHDKRAEPVFVDDLEKTYNHLVQRERISREEAEAEQAAGGREQIQLVPENPEQQITFNVPDGPPPENLILEGPGTEDLDIEEVRKALQLRWDIFEGFPKDLQEALTEGTLESVNKALGAMEVPEAEDVVEKLQIGGIMSFADGGIRDETGGV